MNTRRRPNRSAKRPAGMRSAANEMVYALRTQVSEPLLVSTNVFSRSGNATFIVETFAVTRKAPSAVERNTSRVRHRSTSPEKGVELLPSDDGMTLNTAGRVLLFERVPLAVIASHFKTTQSRLVFRPLQRLSGSPSSERCCPVAVCVDLFFGRILRQGSVSRNFQ